MKGNELNTFTDKPPFLKWREGEKRQTRFNEWYENKDAHREASNFFAASQGGVPNNPENYKTFANDGNLVFNTNPYGDSERISRPDIPQMVKPNQWGDRGFPLPPKPGFDKQFHAGWGSSSPKGTSTSIGSMGSGPQRNVPSNGDKNKDKPSFSLSGGMPVGAVAHEAQAGSWGNAIAAGLRDPNNKGFNK